MHVLTAATQTRGHSRNRTKGGRNYPQRYTTTRFDENFVGFYSGRVKKYLQGDLSAVFCTKLD